MSVFDPGKFEEIELEKYDSLTENEIKVLQLHPKFSIMENISQGGIDFDQETSYSKFRIQLRKEYEERLENEDDDDTKITAEEKRNIEEVSAKTRQTFDPVEKIYDDRKRRGTDLKECWELLCQNPPSWKMKPILK